jgi:hypothetical protein
VFSSEAVQFTDERPFSYTITPNISSTSTTVYGSEGESLVSPCPFSITSLQSANSSITSFTVNVKAYANATVSWSSVPTGVTITNPTAGIYRASGWDTLSKFNAIKNPNIYFGPDRSGNLTYSANLTVSSGVTNSWTVLAVISDSAEINTSTLANLIYNEDYSVTYNSGLEIVDTNPSGTYTVSISKSDNLAGNLTSAGLGGSSVYSSNVLVISGAKNQVNSHLANITFNPTADYNENFNLTYVVNNVSSSVVSYAYQNVVLGFGNDEVTNMFLGRTYLSNKPNYIFANTTPYLSDVDTGDSYQINLTLNSNIGFFETSTDLLARPNWNQSTLTYSFTGNLTQCNQNLANLVFYPTKDTITSTTVDYTQRKNGIFQVTQPFNLVGSTNPSAVAGTGLIRIDEATSFDFLNAWPASGAEWAATYEQLYVLNCDILIIGPGGGGGAHAYTAQGQEIAWGGGGGAGQLRTLTAVDIKTYSNSSRFFVKTAFGPTYFGSLTASAGTTGASASVSGSTRRSGNGGSAAGGFGGGLADNAGFNAYASGGGGGAGSAGGNASRIVSGSTYIVPGTGGNGVTSSFTGNTITYCAGMSGAPADATSPGGLSLGANQIYVGDTDGKFIVTTTPGSGGRQGAIYLKFYV